MGNVEIIYDLACGHGLLGVMLAHRFPRLRVVCVDLKRRPAFDHYLEVYRGFGGNT
jgi:tRNA1(Val) A37 N6-methylase TrmN6